MFLGRTLSEPLSYLFVACSGSLSVRIRRLAERRQLSRDVRIRRECNVDWVNMDPFWTGDCNGDLPASVMRVG
jgi:hypothetical protein